MLPVGLFQQQYHPHKRIVLPVVLAECRDFALQAGIYLQIMNGQHFPVTFQAQAAPRMIAEALVVRQPHLWHPHQVGLLPAPQHACRDLTKPFRITPAVSMRFRVAAPRQVRSSMPAATASGGRLRRQILRERGACTCITTTPLYPSSPTISHSAIVFDA